MPGKTRLLSPASRAFERSQASQIGSTSSGLRTARRDTPRTFHAHRRSGRLLPRFVPAGAAPEGGNPGKPVLPDLGILRAGRSVWLGHSYSTDIENRRTLRW